MTELTMDVVIDAVREVLEHSPDAPDEAPELTAETNFLALSFSSLDVMQLFMILEERVGHPLDPESVSEFKTVGDVLGLRPEAA